MLNPQDSIWYLFTMTNRNPSKALGRAKTRSGTPCKRVGDPINGRCRLHGGKSTGPRTEEGRARIAAAQFKHGNRSKAAIAAQRAKAARGRAIRAELAALEVKVIGEGLLPSNWRDAYRI